MDVEALAIYLVGKMRNKRKMSIIELARAANVNPVILVDIEVHKKLPNLSELDRIFKALGYKFVIGGSRYA